jgi:hypothetical protein
MGLSHCAGTERTRVTGRDSERGLRRDSLSAFRAQIAEAFLPLPDPLLSDREAARAEHADLFEMADSELWRERERCRIRLAIEDESDSWVTERLERIRAEERRRRGAVR